MAALAVARANTASMLIAPDGKVQTMWVGYSKGLLWKTIKEYIK